MKTKELLHMAFTGLRRRKTRTMLTVTGVIIGTVCIILMFGIGLSNYRQFRSQMLEGQSLTRISINSFAATPGATGGITDSMLEQIAGLEHVRAVSPQISMPLTLQTGKYTAVVQVIATDADVLDLKLKEGRLFSDADAMPTLVLSADAVRQFVDEANPPDTMNYEAYLKYVPDIDFLNTEFDAELGYPQMQDAPPSLGYRVKVSGIQEEGQNEQSFQSYLSLDMAKRLIRENRELTKTLGIQLNKYQSAVVIADDMANVQSVLEEIKKFGVEAYSPIEWITQVQEEQARQQGQLLAIGFISLFVSAIGIANTMYASVLERRREIGIMKVVGMRVRKIRALFLTEAAMVGLLGGLIGAAVSYIIVLIINTGSGQTSFLGMYFSEGMKIEIPAWLPMGAVLIAVAVGVISGVYPAKKATRMSPLEAMRNGK